MFFFSYYVFYTSYISRKKPLILLFQYKIVLNKQPLHNKFYLIDYSGQKCPFLQFSKFSKFTNPFPLFKIAKNNDF